MGIIKSNSKKICLDIINKLCNLGIQGVILGCTEIGLLIHQNDTLIPLFDTTLIHAQEAAIKSLK